MHKTGLTLWILLLFASVSLSQNNYHWTHYTAEDGLSQNVVTSILQDRKGFMWFATWDGISRFDGHQFTNYKVRPGDLVDISGSRIDYISEDSHGYLWLLTYGGTVCRFDPINEKFINAPVDKNKDLIFYRIKTLPGGSTWLISEAKGAAQITTDSIAESLSIAYYSESSGKLATNIVNDIFEDNDKNEWLLTDNGICLVGKSGQLINRLFFEQRGAGRIGTSFFCAKDFGDDIWFGSESGHIWRFNKILEQFSLLELPSEASVRAIYALTSGDYLIASDTDGFFVFNGDHDEIRHFSTEKQPDLKSNLVYASYQDKFGDVWFQQSFNRITRFDGNQITKYNYRVWNHDPNNVFDTGFMIHEDINDILWIHPIGGGLSYFDRKSNKLVPFFQNVTSEIAFSDRLHSMHSDIQGNLWMSTRAKGLTKFVFTHNHFHTIQPENHLDDVNDEVVRALAQDHKNNYWVGNKGGKIFVYDTEKNLLGCLGADGKLHKNARFSEYGSYSIVAGQNGVMWLGLKGRGLIRATPCQTKDVCYALEYFSYQANDIYSLSDNNVYDIHEDKSGRLWIATFGGGINLVENPYDSKPRFINSRNRLSNYPISTCNRSRLITSGVDDDMWVATTNGIIAFNSAFTTPENIRFKHYTYTPGDSACLSNNDVHDILVSSDSLVFIATFGGGLNKLISHSFNESPRFLHYTVEKGLPSDVILALVEDERGKIWMTTENGISQFDPQSKTFSNYHRSDYSYQLIFSEAANMKDRDGSIWFGHQTGALWFHPDRLSKSSYVPPLVFTEFRLFNRKIAAGEKSIINKPIDYIDKVVLKHNQNLFSIGFSALDMRYPTAVKYKTKLVGFDSDWRHIDQLRIVDYTNIPHGEYVFMVQSTNSDGVWVDNERQLFIKILPSFWVTPIAYIIYTLLFVLIVVLAGSILTTIVRLRHKVELEHQVAELKLDFFTNISHELRTPLTLINAPLEGILNEEVLSSKAKDQLNSIQKNRDRMMKMVDQILDFVKIQHNKIKMTVEPILLPSFLEKVMDDFQYRAVEESIDFRLISHSNNTVLWADADKLEKIIYNLLSNAFKYIGQGKTITINLIEEETQIKISVKDDGIGISDKQIPTLFERYESSFGGNKNKQQSSGIGLSVVKEFVEMHKAAIEVNSNAQDGTEFSIFFLKGLQHYNKEVEILTKQIPDIANTAPIHEENTENVSPLTNAKNAQKNEQITVLLVEDNREVRSFIKNILQQVYFVDEASNGEEGLEMARNNQIDIIISDIMMPVMDGVSFLQKIREDVETSHIPFILLTAKSNPESKLEGFEKGADDYITKPFSPAFLLVRIENLLELRKQLYHKYFDDNKKTKVYHIEPSPPEITLRDEVFINDIKRYLEDNLDDNTLVVDDLVKETGVSRSVFFNKLKGLTGLAPIEFIRDFRLKRAAQLIESGQYNINQIAFMVGINDARYFSRCFRSLYGMSPSEYKKKNM